MCRAIMLAFLGFVAIPYPPPGAAAVPTDPQGVKWDFENDTENKKRLPKVFARFGR
jgi:hypothetical protein